MTGSLNGEKSKRRPALPISSNDLLELWKALGNMKLSTTATAVMMNSRREFWRPARNGIFVSIRSRRRVQQAAGVKEGSERREAKNARPYLFTSFKTFRKLIIPYFFQFFGIVFPATRGGVLSKSKLARNSFAGNGFGFVFVVVALLLH